MSVGSIVSYCIMNYQSCSFMKNPAGFRLALENGVMDRFLVEIGSLDWVVSFDLNATGNLPNRSFHPTSFWLLSGITWGSEGDPGWWFLYTLVQLFNLAENIDLARKERPPRASESHGKHQHSGHPPIHPSWHGGPRRGVWPAVKMT